MEMKHRKKEQFAPDSWNINTDVYIITMSTSFMKNIYQQIKCSIDIQKWIVCQNKNKININLWAISKNLLLHIHCAKEKNIFRN